MVLSSAADWSVLLAGALQRELQDDRDMRECTFMPETLRSPPSKTGPKMSVADRLYRAAHPTQAHVSSNPQCKLSSPILQRSETSERSDRFTV